MRALLLLCAGCNQLLGVHHFDGGSSGDDMRIIDSQVDANLACNLDAPFSTLEAVTELNTPDSDMVTDISADELTLYLSSDRARPGMGAELFYTTRMSKTAAWTTPLTRFYATSPNWDDVAVAIAPDGLSGLVASNRNGGVEHLWLITRSGATFVDNSTMAPNINSAAAEATPRYSRDGRTLYFDSSRTGNRDLYAAPILPGSFGMPQRILELSTSAQEAAATLTADERTLYYFLDQDIYTATRVDSTSAFGSPMPMPLLNTNTFDAPGVVSSDGCTLYVNHAVPGQGVNVFVARRPAS